MIYFITDGLFVKVGTAKDVPHRLTELQCGNPRRLLVLATCDGDAKLERALHGAIAAKMDGGQEWFFPRPPLLALIARVQARGRAAIERRLAARKRLIRIYRGAAVRHQRKFNVAAAGVVDDICRRRGVKAVAQITGQTESAVRWQRRGKCTIGALPLARLGTVEPEAINALICRAERLVA